MAEDQSVRRAAMAVPGQLLDAALDGLDGRLAPRQKPCCVARWGGSELTSILSAELRNALVADREGDACRVSRLGDQQLVGRKQSDLLLILDRAHARRRLEVTMKRGGAHVGELCQSSNLDRLIVMRPNPGDRPTNLVQAAIGAGKLAEVRALRTLQEPKQDLHPGTLGVVEEGALAGLVLVDGDPNTDIKLLEDPGRNLLVIMKDGKLFKNSVP